MVEWWQLHPIIAPLQRGFMDTDKSHTETKAWMNNATYEIERLRAALREVLHIQNGYGSSSERLTGIALIARAAFEGEHIADAGKKVSAPLSPGLTYEETHKNKRLFCCKQHGPLCADCPDSITIRISKVVPNDAAT